jgi:peptidoglycan/xylan/chitin deacetylase (PgdA/CDA1 family)
VAITFDDAYAELEQEALPVLARNGQTATIYACPGLLGAPSDLVLGGGGVHEDAALMDAAALRRADAAGFAVESHSSTHPRLTSLDDARLAAEVAGSRSALAEVLGREVRHFAYPFGNYDDRVVAAVAAAGYQSAVTTDHGAMADHDLLRVPRVYVSWGVGAVRLVARVGRRAGEG